MGRLSAWFFTEIQIGFHILNEQNNGMDFLKVIEVPYSVLHIVGFQINYDRTIKGFTMAFLATVCLICNILFACLTAHFVVYNVNDFVVIMDSLGLFGTAVFMFVKYMALYPKRNDYRKLQVLVDELMDFGLYWF